MTSKLSKRGVNQVPQELTSPLAFYKYLQSELAMDLINTPMRRVSCPNDENSEKKKIEKKNFGKKISKFLIFQIFSSQDFHHFDN